MPSLLQATCVRLRNLSGRFSLTLPNAIANITINTNPIRHLNLSCLFQLPFTIFLGSAYPNTVTHTLVVDTKGLAAMRAPCFFVVNMGIVP